MSEGHLVVENPKGKVVIMPNGRATIQWDPNFKYKWLRRYTEAQKFVDSEVKRRCEPYTPLLTGSLILSGILGTDVGSGMVAWIAPYAKAQYHFGRRPGTSNTGPLRGRLWFPRMKAVSGKSIIAGARKLAGGR